MKRKPFIRILCAVFCLTLLLTVCSVPALAAGKEYWYFVDNTGDKKVYVYSSVETFGSVTGAECTMSLSGENTSPISLGYTEKYDSYWYDCTRSDFDKYVDYLEEKGFVAGYSGETEEGAIYTYCNVKDRFSLLVILTNEDSVVFFPQEGQETLDTYMNAASDATGATGATGSSAGTSSDGVASDAIACYSGDVRYSAGLWWVPVYIPEETVTNCKSFTLCFRYDSVNSAMLGNHRVYVSLREGATGAWQEFDNMYIAKKGEIYRMKITFNKPRTVGGIALFPEGAIDGSSIGASVWVENPIYG